MDLSEIRKQIDKIDDEMLELFIKRMECSSAVAKFKCQNNLPVLNKQREHEILDEIGEKAGANSISAKLLFSTIMDISRSAQYPNVTKNSPLRNDFSAAFKRDFMPKTVGCQGTDGSYSQAAAKSMFGDCKIICYPAFEDVFKAVKNNEIDAGVLPIENSYAGSVVENYDNILKYSLHINKAVNMPISHCLLANENSDITTINTVYSHEQALNQCADFINEHGFEQQAMTNTAVAAKYVSQCGDKTASAIASAHTADIYPLKILQDNIQTSDKNSTKFIAVARDMCISRDADIISLAFSIEHTSGSLYKMLSMLAAAGLNMTKIESRPDKTSPFEYIFYLDFCGNLYSDEIQGLLCGMNDELPYMKILGNYKIK